MFDPFSQKWSSVILTMAHVDTLFSSQITICLYKNYKEICREEEEKENVVHSHSVDLAIPLCYLLIFLLVIPNQRITSHWMLQKHNFPSKFSSHHLKGSAVFLRDRLLTGSFWQFLGGWEGLFNHNPLPPPPKKKSKREKVLLESFSPKKSHLGDLKFFFCFFSQPWSRPALHTRHDPLLNY